MCTIEFLGDLGNEEGEELRPGALQCLEKMQPHLSQTVWNALYLIYLTPMMPYKYKC